MNIRLELGDCIEYLMQMEDNCVDSVITDPPYGLKFMGKKWDYDVPTVDVWEECLRVIKPGGHLLSFFGTRTYHRGVVRIEDAGFEIRDQLAWMYGSGFPKGQDISKAIDKKMGAKRVLISGTPKPTEYSGKFDQRSSSEREIYSGPVTCVAQAYDGWNTTLKPAWEPIVVARKPPRGLTVVENVIEYGTGGLNIGECRVEYKGDMLPPKVERGPKIKNTWSSYADKTGEVGWTGVPEGRWPANVIHDGSDEVVGLFPDSKGQQGKSGGRQRTFENCHGAPSGEDIEYIPRNDKGSAARFFYCAKASKKDRDSGTREGLPNNHPTVKPTELMRYLCRLVTPKQGTVLDPFMGSGSTGKAAVIEGFGFIGIERDPQYYDIAKARIEYESN